MNSQCRALVQEGIKLAASYGRLRWGRLSFWLRVLFGPTLSHYGRLLVQGPCQAGKGRNWTKLRSTWQGFSGALLSKIEGGCY